MSITRLLTVVAAIACAAEVSVLAQMTAERERAARDAVNTAMDQYNAWFVAGRADMIAERSYLTPSVRMDDAGVTVSSSRDDVRRLFERTLTSLAADGYARTEWPVLNICVLSESAAVVSGRYVRYRKDRTVIGEYGGTYMFAKAADGWRIASFARHDPSKVVGCS